MTIPVAVMFFIFQRRIMNCQRRGREGVAAAEAVARDPPLHAGRGSAKCHLTAVSAAATDLNWHFADAGGGLRGRRAPGAECGVPQPKPPASAKPATASAMPTTRLAETLATAARHRPASAN